MPTLSAEQLDFHIRRKSTLSSDRGTFESHWQEIAERVYPEHANFSCTAAVGEKRMSKVFDSLPIHSNQLLSSGLFSLLTSSASPWFHISPVDFNLSGIREVSMYLDILSKIMYHEINNPIAGFSTAIHEGYLEYGAFGNLTIFVDELLEKQHLRFTALPLYECHYVENQEGIVDTLYRTYTRTAECLRRKFGIENLSEKTQKLLTDNKLDTKVPGVHIILPREVANFLSPKSTDLPFASLYIETDNKHVIHEGGFHELPFMAARFYKSTHEVYGRGPGSTALPDVKMLMQVAKVTIRAAQKTADPPILLPDSGFIRPLRTTPGGLNYYMRGRINTKKDIDILPTGNPGMGIEYSELLHKKIREVFFVDQLQLHTGPQMTATEVMQRTEEKLRLMGPLLGRVQTELLGPLVNRVYGLLHRAGKLPELPAVLAGRPLKIVYTSPIARAQEQVEANGLMRALGVLEPLMQYAPQMTDLYDTDEMGRGIFEMFNINQKYLRDQKTVDKIRTDRAKTEKAQQDAENLRASGQGADSMARAGVTAQDAGLMPTDFGVLQ